MCQKCSINNSKNIYLTKEKCKEIALLYSTKIDFINGNRSVYNKCLKNKWLDELSSHMIKIGNHFNRCIYSYEFTNNFVYVGLTYNLDKRNAKHLTDVNSPVFLHSEKYGLYPTIRQITDYIDKCDAIIMEYKVLSSYILEGWNILNRIKTGGLGGKTIKWTKERCIEVSLECKSRKSFIDDYPGAYISSVKNGWIDYVYSNINTIVKHKNYWTKEKCIEIGLLYGSKVELRNNNISCYNTSIRNGWIDDVCSHMLSDKTPKGFWNRERCLDISKNYINRTQFRKENPGAYKACKKNNWLNEFFI
jgi:predicted GIY-YIG superfamily endonuclease